MNSHLPAINSPGSTQAACKIIPNIDHSLQSNRDADQAVGDTCCGARLRGNAPVGGAGRMGDGGLGVAEVGCDRNHPSVVDHAPRGILTVLDLEGHNAAASFLLAHRQLMLWMRR